MRNVFLLAVSLVAVGCASTPSTPRPATWLRGADCLDPGTARSWHDVSATELLVDAGRRKYRLTVSAACTRLGLGPVLRFDGDPISGRVCGTPSDAVLLDDGQRCPIERMELVDATTWQEAQNAPHGQAHGETPVR